MQVSSFNQTSGPVPITIGIGGDALPNPWAEEIPSILTKEEKVEKIMKEIGVLTDRMRRNTQHRV